MALGNALRHSKVSKLAELDLSNNDIRAKGAKAIAGYISVSASLTKLDVHYNQLGEDGEAALRKAVEDRSGFELSL